MSFAVNSTVQRCTAQGFQGCERALQTKAEELRNWEGSYWASSGGG